jgi:hypothetical protein
MSSIGIVTFNYQVWAARYPMLATSVTQPAAQSFFDEATLYLDNSPGSLVRDVGKRAVLLGMLTAHIATLNAPINGQEPSGLVGRITNASQGSVSVAVQNDYPPGTVQWYQQTAFGAAFYAATATYRTARYLPAPRGFGVGFGRRF